MSSVYRFLLFRMLPCVVGMAIGIVVTVHAQAAENRYSTTATVLDGCAVYFEIEKPPGIYTLLFHGRPYPLADVTKDSDIDSHGLYIVGKVVQYMAEPASNRPKLAITQIINSETVVASIDYDDETLSQQLNTCFRTDSYTPPPTEQVTDSRSAIKPEPSQLRLQAKALAIDIADFYNCPCGEAFSSVQMQSPPWSSNTLMLQTSGGECTLQTTGISTVESMHAAGSAKDNQTSCGATVGMTTRYHQVNFRPAFFPNYSQYTQQACYNIIAAKAQQWFRDGGEISVVNEADRTGVAITAAMIDQLNCSVP